MFKFFKTLFKSQKTSEHLIKKSNRNFKGYNLNEWMYLGYTKVKWSDTTPDYIHFFCRRNDMNDRSFIMTNTAKHHGWVRQGTPELWKAGQREVYECIAFPDTDLRNYMKETHSHSWDSEKSWWVPIENAKYQKAVSTQAKKQEPNKKNDGNVTHIEFKK
jgi:hypothetical protein